MFGFCKTCSKCGHSSARHKKIQWQLSHLVSITSDSWGGVICTAQQCCSEVIVYILRRRATLLSLPCQHAWIFVEVKLTCLVVVLLLYHSCGRLSSGGDLLSFGKMWLCLNKKKDGISWHQTSNSSLICGSSCSVKCLDIAGGGCHLP